MKVLDTNTGYTAVVTGASSGIGLEYAREFCARGYDVVMVSNEDLPLREAAEALAAAHGVRTYAVCMDLAVADAARRLHDYCRERELVVDVLVNNAGVFRLDHVVDIPAGRVEMMLTLHVTTPALLCRLFGEDMKERGRGYMLNMSSLSAWFPYPGISLYAPTKAFVKSFSRAFRSEMLDYGVSVTVICPGAVATDLYGLPHHLQRLAVRLGVMLPPAKLARRAVRGMFRRRGKMIPGVFNYFLIVFLKLIPPGVIRRVMHVVMKRIKANGKGTTTGKK